MAALSLNTCLALLDLAAPRITGKTQEEVDARLQEWKDGPLKTAYRAAAKRAHPDQNPGTAAAEEFQKVKAAYDFLCDVRGVLRVPVTACPKGHARVPEKANFCHECGHAYDDDPLTERLRKAGLTSASIAKLHQDGTMERLRALPPTSAALQQEILRQLQRQRVWEWKPDANPFRSGRVG